MTTESNKDLAMKAFDALNKQDAAGLEAVFSPKWAANSPGCCREYTRFGLAIASKWPT